MWGDNRAPCVVKGSLCVWLPFQVSTYDILCMLLPGLLFGGAQHRLHSNAWWTNFLLIIWWLCTVQSCGMSMYHRESPLISGVLSAHLCHSSIHSFEAVASVSLYHSCFFLHFLQLCFYFPLPKTFIKGTCRYRVVLPCSVKQQRGRKHCRCPLNEVPEKSW